MAISDKLNELITQRNNLADNLNTMGVSASQEETLTTLVPKVLDIQTGGTEVTKGIIIKEQDNDGFATDVEIVGMTEIPNGYFYTTTSTLYKSYFTNLKNVKLPDNVTNIKDYAFNNCVNLVSLNIPSLLNKIGKSAFYNCKNLELPSLPNGIISIDGYAFYNCEKINFPSLPSGLTSIGAYTFYTCKNLSLTNLPNGITSIGNNAFYETNVSFTSLPENITTILYSTFQNCKNLALTSLPSGLTSIGNQAFYVCPNIKLTELPSGLTSIGENAFYGCKLNTFTEIPSGVLDIKQYCFAYNEGLTELTCLGDLNTIETYSFSNCKQLTKLILPNLTSPPILKSTYAFTGTPIKSGTGYIYVPDELVNIFKSASNWSTYASQIKGVSEL